MYRKVYKYLHVNTIMVRKITAEIDGKLNIQEDVEEIYERKVTSYGNGAKIDAQKKNLGKRAIVIILKD